jgi:hypothetical protein
MVNFKYRVSLAFSHNFGCPSLLTLTFVDKRYKLKATGTIWTKLDIVDIMWPFRFWIGLIH